MLDSLKQKKNFQRIKMRIKTGDFVKVINGKDKGKTGEVLKEHNEGPELDVAPYISCFGVDVYERDGELVSENEYAQAL